MPGDVISRGYSRRAGRRAWAKGEIVAEEDIVPPEGRPVYEVPPAVRTDLVTEHKVSKRDMREYW